MLIWHFTPKKVARSRDAPIAQITVREHARDRIAVACTEPATLDGTHRRHSDGPGREARAIANKQRGSSGSVHAIFGVEHHRKSATRA